MSGASDKARFYLEKAVPQLQEFEQKKIFTKDEIRTLVKKRSDFEHKVLARGSQPVDFARYAAWEISLERLRAKRCKRLRIKGSSAHAGQARIFSIFDRGTKKHFGDLSLWMSYLEFARESKATKKFKTVLTSAIRLHCTKAELWLYAAKWTLEIEADMNGARSYMQRGTRFCTRSKDLWIEYARLEMIFLAKISLRRRILGLDAPMTAKSNDEVMIAQGSDGFSSSADVIAVPGADTYTMQASSMDGVKVDGEAVDDPMTTPALNGAIPLAIFEDARNQPFYNAGVGEDFFNMFAIFTQVACQGKLLDHVLSSMVESYPSEAATCGCTIRQPLIGIDPKTADFPVALGSALERLKLSMENVNDKAQLSKKTAAWIEPILAIENIDPDIRQVLKVTKQKLE
ncbi:MAG: U3 snoRNP protein [Claussenomyces sp. TS43310]|nr:MAG: U3 snoRNP protein [Claussenomyces sp. TS43310]